ncbi:hypothetical protein GCM10025871_40640 [Deinococcus metallilatus]|nr:hypothetical protein GCM10025871_40640 [Deinococcus metallilatus]
MLHVHTVVHKLGPQRFQPFLIDLHGRIFTSAQVGRLSAGRLGGPFQPEPHPPCAAGGQPWASEDKEWI